MMKIAKLNELQSRLYALLGDRPDLAAAFAHALSEQDEALLASAFEGLREAPNDLRLAVEAAILDWLFGDLGRATEPDPFAGYPEVSSLVH